MDFNNIPKKVNRHILKALGSLSQGNYEKSSSFLDIYYTVEDSLKRTKRVLNLKKTVKMALLNMTELGLIEKTGRNSFSLKNPNSLNPMDFIPEFDVATQTEHEEKDECLESSTQNEQVHSKEANVELPTTSRAHKNCSVSRSKVLTQKEKKTLKTDGSICRKKVRFGNHINTKPYERNRIKKHEKQGNQKKLKKVVCVMKKQKYVSPRNLQYELDNVNNNQMNNVMEEFGDPDIQMVETNDMIEEHSSDVGIHDGSLQYKKDKFTQTVENSSKVNNSMAEANTTDEVTMSEDVSRGITASETSYYFN